MEDTAFNPYRSFVISASAGSGKTYQLVQRYLRLAATLPDGRLSRVLTVTFTRKAAAEMRQRIIEGAAGLLASPGAVRKIEQELKTWSPSSSPPGALPAANRILRNSQSMRVVTMDSFFGWLVGRFAVEAGLPVSAEIAEGAKLNELDQTAWFRLLNTQECQPLLAAVATLLEGDLQPIREFCEEFYHTYRPTLYLQYRGDTLGIADDLSLPEEDDYSLAQLERDIWNWLQDLLSRPGWESPSQSRAELGDFLRKRDLPGLLSSGFFKPQREGFPREGRSDIRFSLSLNRLPAPLRERAPEADSYLERYFRVRRLEAYNRLIVGLVGIYGWYEKIMKALKAEIGVIDFADVAVGAFHLLDDPGIAFTVQSGLQHLLIDEFQDTSRLQWAIFQPMMEELLAGKGIFEEQSFFAVGDLKQSIYGFREADYTLLENLAAEAKRSPVLQLLSLRRSYRSAPLIIDYINAVFQRSELSGFEEHVTSLPEVGGWLAIYPLVGKDEGGGKKEARWELDSVRVAEAIRRLVQDRHPVAEKAAAGAGDPSARPSAGPASAPPRVFDGACPPPQGRASSGFRPKGVEQGAPDMTMGLQEYRHRPVRYGDIAVIYRKKASARFLEAEMARRGIPCRREEPGGFYQRREVQDLLALLSFLCDPEDALALSILLRSPLIGMSEKEYAEILLKAGGGRSLWETLRGRRPEFAAPLSAALEEAGRRPIAEVVELFLENAGARLRYRLSSRDELSVLNLDKLVDLLASLSARGANSSYECRRALLRMSEEDETRMAGGAGDCVRLMTVHQAKGLEFKVLFLVDAAFTFPGTGRDKSFNLLRHRRPGSPPVVYFPPKSFRPADNPVFNSWAEQAESEDRREEWRILYVAITRAAQYLFISGVVPGTKEAAFYEHLLSCARKLAASGRWQVREADPAGQEVAVALVDPATLPPLAALPAALPEEVDGSLFIRPIRPMGPMLLRPSAAEVEEMRGEDAKEPPEIPAKNRVLGAAVHRVMEALVQEAEWSIDALLDPLMEKDHPDRAWVAGELEKDARTMGESEIFGRLRGAGLKTEVPVLDYRRGTPEGDRLVTGTIDLLAIFPDRVEFYEYKTTRIVKGRERAATEKYRLQMDLYARALERIYARPVSGFLVFTKTGRIMETITLSAHRREARNTPRGPTPQRR